MAKRRKNGFSESPRDPRRIHIGSVRTDRTFSHGPISVKRIRCNWLPLDETIVGTDGTPTTQSHFLTSGETGLPSCKSLRLSGKWSQGRCMELPQNVNSLQLPDLKELPCMDDSYKRPKTNSFTCVPPFLHQLRVLRCAYNKFQHLLGLALSCTPPISYPLILSFCNFHLKLWRQVLH